MSQYGNEISITEFNSDYRYALAINDVLNLHGRQIAALQTRGIDYVGELIRCGNWDPDEASNLSRTGRSLLGIVGIGIRSTVEITTALNDFGLPLNTLVRDAPADSKQLKQSLESRHPEAKRSHRLQEPPSTTLAQLAAMTTLKREIFERAQTEGYGRLSRMLTGTFQRSHLSGFPERLDRAFVEYPDTSVGPRQPIEIRDSNFLDLFQLKQPFLFTATQLAALEPFKRKLFNQGLDEGFRTAAKVATEILLRSDDAAFRKELHIILDSFPIPKP